MLGKEELSKYIHKYFADNENLCSDFEEELYNLVKFVYDDGYKAGEESGYSKVVQDGDKEEYNRGFLDGSEDAYYELDEQTYYKGYNEGYLHGYDDGKIDCRAEIIEMLKD